MTAGSRWFVHIDPQGWPLWLHVATSNFVYTTLGKSLWIVTIHCSFALSKPWPPRISKPLNWPLSEGIRRFLWSPSRYKWGEIQSLQLEWSHVGLQHLALFLNGSRKEVLSLSVQKEPTAILVTYKSKNFLLFKSCKCKKQVGFGSVVYCNIWKEE